MKHTPGPWFAVKYPDTKGHTVWANGVSSLASVKHNQPHTQEANARLIAAAPEMLEFMHEIAQLAHTGGFPNMTTGELRRLLFGCGNRAMRAIAKAKGE